MKKLAVLASAVITTGIVMASPAHADQWDYVSYLDSKGVSYSTTFGVIGLGKQVCHELRDGTALEAVARYLVGPMDYSVAEAAIIVFAATETMCRDAIPAVQQQVNNSDSQLA